MCNMKLVTCPDIFECEMVDHTFKVFLGGGITNCPNWQLDMIDMLNHADNKLVLFNPRRDAFDITNENDSEFQIEWEFEHLGLADAILFWFPKETLCPITLYELGAAAAKGKTIFVGCHPEYARRFDVKKQLSMVRPGLKVRDSLDDVAKEVMSWYSSMRFGS